MPAADSPKPYCVKCKTKRSISGITHKNTKNGAVMACGKCTTCGTKACIFQKKH